MKTKHFLIAFLIAGVSLGLGGCKTKTTPSSPTSDNFRDILAAQSQLKKFSSREEMKSFFAKRPAVNTANVMALDSRASATKEAAPVASGTAAATGLGGGGGQSFSTTNIQVEGIDESDVSKTDGSYIYSLSEQNVIITRALPADKLAIVSTIKLDSRPQELYVHGDKLIVFGFSNQAVSISSAKIAAPYLLPQSSFTFIAAYDISDRSAPRLVRRLELEGNYVSSRLIENRLYFVTSTYNFYPLADETPLPRVMENGKVISSDQDNATYRYPEVYYVDTPSSLNATTVTLFDLDHFSEIPSSQVYLMPSSETVYASHDNLYLAYTKYLSEYQLRMTVAREILASHLSPRQRQLIEQISATDGAILNDDEKLNKINQVIESYIASLSPDEQTSFGKQLEEEFNRRHPDLGKELEKTVIHKISLADGRLSYQGSGEVSGRLLNQYSIDEYGGNLRLATTRQRNWFMPFFFGRGVAADIAPAPSESYNNIYVLDGSLKTIGSIEDLAQGESIYSVRFMGVRGYLVTFRQVDPLFVLDLAVPEKPVVLGQLKVPGFSNYLHPYSDTIMIGLGKEATEQEGQRVEVGGLKVSLFDVSVPADPKEISSVVLGGRGSDSSALYDYKAVLFSKEKNLLAFPATLVPKNATDYRADFQGMMVLDLKADKVSERGRIAFRLPEQMSNGSVYLDDSARRALYIGDSLYSLSGATIKANRLPDLKALASLDLPRPEIVTQPVKPLPYETPAAPQR